MNTIKKSELTRFFDIISKNELDSKAKVEAYGAEKQLEASKVGVLTDEGTALRKEFALIANCHNYLSDIATDTSVKELLKEYMS